MPDIFDTLSSFSLRLDEASRKANAILKQARARLAEKSLGIEASILLKQENFWEAADGAKLLELTYLLYASRGRIGEISERWDLWIECFEASADGSSQRFTSGPFSVLECEREIRIAAAQAIPRLVKALQQAAEKTIADLDAAAKSLS